MASFGMILQNLKALQTQLKLTGDSLWRIKSEIQKAHHEGHQVGDFLPRRLALLQSEAQDQLENLLLELRQMASESLNPHLFVFTSPKEVKTVLKIKQTLRYLQNAYMDHSLRETLNHWDTLLS